MKVEFGNQFTEYSVDPGKALTDLKHWRDTLYFHFFFFKKIILTGSLCMGKIEEIRSREK